MFEDPKVYRVPREFSNPEWYIPGMDLRKRWRAASAAALIAGTCLLLPARADEKPAWEVPNKPGEIRPEQREGKLKPGDMAADFTLKVMHSEDTVTLSGFKGNRPVALIFGSYT